MATAAICLLFLAPFCVVSVSLEGNGNPLLVTNDRLAKIEAVLEAVLMKNAELESRVEVLEDENQRLKEAMKAIVTPQDGTKNENNDDVDVDIEDGKGIFKTQRSLRDNHQKKRDDRQTRILLSAGDTTVGFTAAVSSPQLTGLGRAQTVIYDRTITNIGGGYHNHTGVFIAPISGLYGFSVDLMVEPGDIEHLEIVKDGKSIFKVLAHGLGESRYETSSRTVILNVRQGSEVWVRTFVDSVHIGSGTIHGNQFSSFSGWLVAPTEM